MAPMKVRPLPLLLATATALAASARSQVAPQFQSSLLPGVSFPLATDVVFGDSDGDGDLDQFLLSSFGGKLYRNDGSGVFTDVTAALPVLAGNQRTAAFVDLDGDGRRDLLLGWTGLARLFRSMPDGSWLELPANLPSGLPTVHGALGVDLDGDGDEDLVCAGHILDGGRNQLLTNDGTGVFMASEPFPGTAFQALVEDIDGDGDRDVLFARGGMQLWRNDGAGVFTDVSASQLPVGVGSPAGLAFGDVDGDGTRDLVLGASSLGDRVLENDGLGTFTLGATIPSGGLGSATTVALADVDADGDLDFVRGTANYGQPTLLLNDGFGNFTNAPLRLPVLTTFVAQMRAADLDGDGDPDVVLSGLGVPPAVLWNLHRHLVQVAPPAVGALWELDLASQPGYGGAGRFGLLAIGLGRLPAPLPIVPYGVLGLDPAAPFVTFAAAYGAGDAPFRFQLGVPGVSALRGLPLFAQGLVEEAAGGALRFTALLATAIR